MTIYKLTHLSMSSIPFYYFLVIVALQHSFFINFLYFLHKLTKNLVTTSSLQRFPLDKILENPLPNQRLYMRKQVNNIETFHYCFRTKEFKNASYTGYQKYRNPFPIASFCSFFPHFLPSVHSVSCCSFPTCVRSQCIYILFPFSLGMC